MAKTPSHPLQLFSTKPSQSPPPNNNFTLNSTKIKKLIHTLIISHLSRVARLLTKLKSVILDIVNETRVPLCLMYPTKEARKRYKNKKIFFGSFRLHYNWCSSHVLPVQESLSQFYYNSTWNAIATTNGENFQDVNNGESYDISAYLQWLEEVYGSRNGDGAISNDISNVDGVSVNEIDLLADLFITNCHEKFRLEKQESYRRFQEMMAKSV